MALVVETGAVISGANSYVSVADADAYHTDRNNTSWISASTAQKIAALLMATAYVDGKYRQRWKGGRVQPFTQALEWPRINVQVDTTGLVVSHAGASNFYPANVIPPEVKSAVCEGALRALSAPLAADLAPGIKRTKVDVIETEYSTSSAESTTYQVIDQLLIRYLKNGSDAVRG